jgi:hypothetical protein
VDGFDHHCIWINNCIGKYNYKVFIGMILTAEGHLFSFLLSVIMLWVEDLWRDYLVSMVLTWIIFAVVVLFSLLLLALIILHFFLIWRNITTYEYMLARKNAQIIPSVPAQKGSNTQFQISSNEINPKERTSIISEMDNS